jgi:hypothetical protein
MCRLFVVLFDTIGIQGKMYHNITQTFNSGARTIRLIIKLNKRLR